MFQRKPSGLKTYGRAGVRNITGISYVTQMSWKAFVNEEDDFDKLLNGHPRCKDLENKNLSTSTENSSVDEVRSFVVKKLVIDLSSDEEVHLSSLRPKKRNGFCKKVKKKSINVRQTQKIVRNDTIILDGTSNDFITKKPDNSKGNKNKNLPILNRRKKGISSEDATLVGDSFADFDQLFVKRNLRSTKRVPENPEKGRQRSSLEFEKTIELDKRKEFISVRRRNKQVPQANEKENGSILNVRTATKRKISLKSRFIKEKCVNSLNTHLNNKCDPSSRNSIDDFIISGKSPPSLRTGKKKKISISIVDLDEDGSKRIPNFLQKGKQFQNFNKGDLIDASKAAEQVPKNGENLTQNVIAKPQNCLKRYFIPVVSTPINDKCETLTIFRKHLGGTSQATPSPVPNLESFCSRFLPNDSDIAVISLNSPSLSLKSISSNLSGILEESSKLDEDTCNTPTFNNNNLNISDCVKISRNLYRTTIFVSDKTTSNNELKDSSISALLSGSKCPRKRRSETGEILELCNQKAILQFDDLFAKRLSNHNAKKVSEGAFSEVFKIKFENGWYVAKIIPVGGKNPCDGEEHMSFKAVLTEITISKALSKLREASQNSCSTFIQLFETRFVKGGYPKGLIRAWTDYASENKTENYNPGRFDKDQLYVVLKYEDGGRDLEHTPGLNYFEVLSVYRQLSCALAVAEQSLNFEHRDLHLGNILFSKTMDKCINYVINGEAIEIETSGVQVRIIDHTLSRLRLNNVNIFTNLSEYDIFNGTGDSQYNVYREMKSISKNHWDRYHPETNVLWLSFVLEKLFTQIKRSKQNVSNLVLFQKRTILKGRSSAFECMRDVINSSSALG